MIQIYDEPAEAIKTTHKKGNKLTSSQVLGMITVVEFQEHDLSKNLDGNYTFYLNNVFKITTDWSKE